VSIDEGFACMYNQAKDKGMMRMEWLRVFLLAFGTFFIAELGDKTQLVAISLAGATKRPLPTFLGAIMALSILTLAAVFIGSFIASRIPAQLFHRIAGGIFIIVGVLMLVMKG